MNRLSGKEWSERQEILRASSQEYRFNVAEVQGVECLAKSIEKETRETG
jgi:hypothetical protein